VNDRNLARIVLAMALALGSGRLKAQDAPGAKAAPATEPATAPTTEPAHVSADARAILDQLNEAYGKLKSLDLAGTLSSDIDAAGQKLKASTAFTASYSAPNKFRHASKGDVDDILWGSTGEKT
jgi:hypothetical protein